MIRHSLRRVRMNPADKTLHCTSHGLLPDDEAAIVLERIGRSRSEMLARNADLGPLWRAFDWIVSRLPARCEAVR